MQTRIVLLLIVAAAFVGCNKSDNGSESGAHGGRRPAAGTPAKTTGAATIVGKWELVSLVEGGEVDRDFIGTLVEFTGTQMIIHYPGDKPVQNYALDAANKYLDFEDARDGKKFLGICELKGDELRLAAALPGDTVRPTDFEAGSAVVVMVMRRKE